MRLPHRSFYKNLLKVVQKRTVNCCERVYDDFTLRTSENRHDVGLQAAPLAVFQGPNHSVFDFQYKSHRGACDSIQRKPSGTANRRIVPGTKPVFLSCARTSNLLALLQRAVRLHGVCNSRRRARRLRRRMRHSLGAISESNDVLTRDHHYRASREKCLGNKKAQLGVHLLLISMCI